MSSPNKSEDTAIEWITNPEHKPARYYANFVNALWTMNDMTLKFGELVQIREATAKTPKKLMVEERANVTMTWIEAKILNIMLSDVLSKFEAANGELKAPKIP